MQLIKYIIQITLGHFAVLVMVLMRVNERKSLTLMTIQTT